MSLEGLAVNLQHNFQIISCYKCQALFAVPEAVRQRWLDSGDSFFCPAGHSQHYTESNIQKLQKQLEREKREKEWAQTNARAEREARQQTERRLIARKGVTTRLRNRIKNGVCPCCTRTFMNLQQHMKSQHPEFLPDDETRATVNGEVPRG
jgi:hypothetical protein